MAIRIMHDNGVNITAKDDASNYYALASYEKHWINEFFGNKFSVTNSGLTATLNTGSGSIYGHHLYSESTINAVMPPNFTGWLVIRYDTSASVGNEGTFLAVTTPTQNDLQDGGLVYDMPLYRIITNSSSVTTFQDFRQYKEKFGVAGLGYHQVNVNLTAGSYSSTTRIATWTTSINLTDRIFAGSKIKYQSNLGTTYCIVHAITPTSITFFHPPIGTSLRAPTTPLLNVGIGRPADFPAKSQWKVRGSLTTSFTQNNPVIGSNYSVFSQTIGVGEWDVNVQGNMKASGATSAICQIGIGSGTPTLSSSKFAGSSQGVTSNEWNTYSHQETIAITTNTTFTYWIKALIAGTTVVAVDGLTNGVFMEFTSSYA